MIKSNGGVFGRNPTFQDVTVDGNLTILAGDLTLTNGNFIVGTSGKGISFAADANAAGMTSELLNDYEEGTWTPVLSDGTNNATMTATTSGRYTKIGNIVTVQAYVETTSLGSVSGNLRITGLPFVAANLDSAYGAGNTVAVASGLAITQYSAVSVRGHPNQSYCVPNVWDATTGTTVMQGTEWTADGAIAFSYSYRAS